MVKQVLGIAIGVAAFYAIRNFLPASIKSYVS